MYAQEQQRVLVLPLARLPGQDRTSVKAHVRSHFFAALLNSCHFKCFSCFCDQKEAVSAARSLPEQTTSGLLWPAPKGSRPRCAGARGGRVGAAAAPGTDRRRREGNARGWNPRLSENENYCQTAGLVFEAGGRGCE